MDWNARILVICDASLPALVGCVAAKEASLAARQDGSPPPARPIAWVPGGLPETQRQAAIKMGQTYGLEVLEQHEQFPTSTPDTAESAMLVHAAYAAAHHGCAGVLWPAIAGGDEPDVNVVARLIDKALLVGRLCALDAERHSLPGIRVDAPYADLSDGQIADLARDLDVRVALCWWWESADGTREKDRWTAAYEKIGTPIA